MNVILSAMTNAKFPNVVEADIFMRMKYETAFGIYNHDAPESKEVPFPLLALTPRESLTLLDPLDFRLDQYAENMVNEQFGIPFHELIQFPRADYLKVIGAAKKFASKKMGLTDAKVKELERLLAQQHQQQTPPKHPKR